MKKFHYALGTVLDYKQQVLDAKQAEHAALLAQVRGQEEVLSLAEYRYGATNRELRRKEQAGITIAEARSYEVGLQVLEREILREREKLAALRRAEEQKRGQVVAAKQEAMSLEKLREKRLRNYNREAQKAEEQLIDELAGAGMGGGAVQARTAL